MSRAVFLDRDGVLNVLLPGDYVKSPSELTLLPGVAEAIARLRTAGFLAIVISNQQGVGKGVMTAADLDAVTAALRAAIALDDVYTCPSLAAANDIRRKPAPGMILEAAAAHRIDLARSVFVGDTKTDAQAARAAGVGAFVLVTTGHCTAADAATLVPPPDAVVDSLCGAADWILARL